MGWASGSSILSSVWSVVRDYVPSDERKDVLIKLMHVFANEDCDTLSELICSEWPEAEAAYDELYGNDE